MRDYKPRCGCGKYCGYTADCGIPFGCKYTPDPEPLDEEYFCNNCSMVEQEKFEKAILKNGEGVFSYCYWWQKPSFVFRALKKTGFEMNRSSDNTHFILNKK